AERTWYANRYAFCIGSGNNALSNITAMKAINPKLKALVYDLFILQAPDTVLVKNWAISKGYNFDSLVLRLKNTLPADSVRVRVQDFNAVGFGRFVTTQPGGILLSSGYTDAQTRFCWDFRNPKVGEYLAYRWKAAAQSIGYDGVFVDEEAIIGYTANNPGGIFSAMAPFKDIIPSLWSYGSPYTSLTRNWGNAFDLEDADAVHSYVDVRDSLRRARKGWMKTAGDLMASYGLQYVPNFAANPVSALPNWAHEGKVCASYARAYVMGEYSYVVPCNPTQLDNNLTMMNALFSVKDSAFQMYPGWITGGDLNVSAGMDIERIKTINLGYMLVCNFRGSTTYNFSLAQRVGQVYWWGGYGIHDSTAQWSDAFGKYFGLHSNIIDSSNDNAAGDKVRLVDYKDPRDATKVLTKVYLRLASQASTDSATTFVAITTPASPTGQWFRLESRTKTSSIAGYKWTKHTASTINVYNGSAFILSSDTILANGGTTTGGGGGGGGDVTAPATVTSALATPGTSYGELNLQWTAPGDDGSTGTVTGYEIMFRDSTLGLLTAANYASSTTLNKVITPVPGGSPQQVILNTTNGLVAGRTYYFAIKAYDEAGNYSPISNIAKSKTNNQGVTPCSSGATCTGSTGNLNCDQDNVVDVADLVLLIDYLFMTLTPPCCLGEADINASGGAPDINDITILINFLFNPGTYQLPPCKP
ncbi:MAG: fibronectin type III domain-containing protein, partial [candidate division Zixibacteria bacterium]|nr:fibronectin type III domain-containing protein [candidate division Zixibacteria bacterium]